MARFIIPRVFVLLAALYTGGISRADETPAWPQVNGPFGNFNPRQYDVKLVDDLSQARQRWVSEYRDLGFAKGSSSGYVRHLTEADTHPGAASGLIVAEGRVFASSYRPAGEVWAEKLPHLLHDKNKAYLADDKTAAVLRRNAAILADDRTVAIDLNTGKTLWEAVESGRGLNRYSGKRNHFGVTPAHHNGRIFSMGTTGILYCYDAATGRKIWEDAKGALVKLAEDEKQKLLRERNGFADGDGMSASLVVADGVLIVPQFTGSTTIPLRGVDIDSGKTLWEVADATCKYATPAVWSHNKRQYVLCANIGQYGKPDSGQLRLIDAKSGRVLWTVTGLEPTWYPLAPSESHVLVNVNSAHQNPKKQESWGRMAAYRLSPAGAERVWTMPDKPQFWFENHFDICCMRRVVIRDGRVYFFSQGHTLDPAVTSRFFSILDEATGEVLHTSDAISGSPQFWAVENRLLVIPDAAHSDRSTVELYTTDPADFRKLGESWKPPHENTTAYEVFIEAPLVNGMLLMRNRQGQVVCYDLRRE